VRNAWEGGGADLDAPATLTERELRSLRRKARAGVLAMVLVLMMSGAVGYAMVAGPEDVRTIRDDIRSRLGLTRGVESAIATEPGPTAAAPETTGVPPPPPPAAADSAHPAAAVRP
jgi:hypothetical protein